MKSSKRQRWQVGDYVVLSDGRRYQVFYVAADGSAQAHDADTGTIERTVAPKGGA